MTAVPFFRYFTAGLLFGAVLLSTGCGEDGATAGQAAKKRPKHRVEVAAVERTDLAVSVVRTGTLRARRQVRISPREEGLLAKLPYYEGDRVEGGELLFALDDTLLRAELKKAQAQRRQAELDVQRLEGIARKAVTEDDIARARTALDVARAEEELLRTRLGHTEGRAPFDGLVSERRADPGDSVARFDHLMTLIDPASLVTEVQASELLLPKLAPGNTVEVRIDALGGSHPARILRIHPTVDPLTRQGKVEIALDSPPPGARPGQLCRVTLTGRSEPRLAMPFAALRRDATGEFVFLVDADGKVHRRAVETGERFGDKIAIADGLDEADRVVTKGFLGLGDGAPVETVSPADP